MRGQTQVFNRFGPVAQDLSDPLNIPSASEEAVAESAAIGEAEEQADESNPADETGEDLNPAPTAAEIEAAQVDEPLVPNDADGDGHDDDNGQFVEGNEEASAS